MKSIKKILTRIYLILDKKRRIFPKGINRTLNFGQIKLHTDILDAGGYDYYNSRKSYEGWPPRTAHPLRCKDPSSGM